MTVSSTIRRATYTGNGATTAFPWAFKVFVTTDIDVFLTVLGVTTPQAVGTHYTILLNTDQNANPGGTVTMLIAPVTGSSLLLLSDVPVTQNAHLTSVGGAIIEAELDRAIIGVQQVVDALPGVQILADQASVSAAAAAASAAAALASENTATADVVLTHADVVLTHADVVLTHADVISTAADVVSTAAMLAAASIPSPVVALSMLRVNAGGSAYESRTVAQVPTDLGLRTSATGSTIITARTTAQRDADTPAPGHFGYNLTTKQYECYGTSGWGKVGGGTTGGGTDAAFYENDHLITTDYTIGQAGLVSGATVTIATPGVVTLTGHGFIAGQMVFFQTTGALPTGLVVDWGYYVIATGLTADTFQLSLTDGGAAINTTGTQSGIHSCGKIKNAGTFGDPAIATGVTITVPTGASWTWG